MITNKKIKNNWIVMLLIILIFLFIIGLYLLYSGSKLSSEASATFYNFNLNEKKEQLKTEVQNRLDEIDYERKNIHIQEQELIKEKVYTLANHLIHTDLSQESNFEKKQELAINFIEDHILKDPNLYFVIDPQGKMLRSGTNPKINGNNISNLKDAEGNYYIQEIISAKDYNEGIYVEYYWPKVKNGDPLKKTSYCLYIEEYDFIIGTGYYYEDVQNALKERIYTRLQSYYENKENYIFVIDFDSTARVFVTPELVGTSTNDLVAYDGKRIHEGFMNIIEENDDGYLKYQFRTKQSEALSEKISYVHVLKDWEAYIGLGFQTDELNNEVSNFTNFITTFFKDQLFIITGLLIILVALILFFYTRGIRLEKNFLKQGDIVFEKLFDYSKEAIIVVSKQQELLYANEKVKDSFHDIDVISYLINNKDLLNPISENIYSFETKDEREYYIDMRVESVSFKGQDAQVYFINNITKQYMENHKLQQLAFKDTLTGLKNRRALKEYLDDILYDLLPNQSLIFGIIDIDHFKVVNDTYGHNIGDEVLILLAEIFEKNLRHQDAIYRYGGEEFVIIMHNISLDKAQTRLERINRDFEGTLERNYPFSCTFSGGIIKIDENNKNLAFDDYVKNADTLLYKAKENGRNRIET